MQLEICHKIIFTIRFCWNNPRWNFLYTYTNLDSNIHINHSEDAGKFTICSVDTKCKAAFEENNATQQAELAC